MLIETCKWWDYRVGWWMTGDNGEEPSTTIAATPDDVTEEKKIVEHILKNQSQSSKKTLWQFFWMTGFPRKMISLSSSEIYCMSEKL